MNSITFYNREKLKQHTRWRWGEEKMGETVRVVPNWQAVKESNAPYVILGIPEDIGVRANYGKAGTAKAWNACLDAFCNIQSNEYTKPENAIILGEINCNKKLLEAQQLDPEDPFLPTKMGSLIKEIDDKVSEVIEKIVSFNKIPIVIGGGHNNSYGNLKGTSKAFGKAINCVNMDAHSDFRTLEHRHSGNGFSYAFEEGFLNNYYIVGLHRNYTSASLFSKLNEMKDRIQFTLFEEILMEKPSFSEALLEAKNFIEETPFGVELDLDAIAGMGSSAQSPTGFTLEQARQYVQFFANHKNCTYFHFCEGAPAFENHTNQVGKTLAYLISDVISL